MGDVSMEESEASGAAQPPTAPAVNEEAKQVPTVIVVIGMAGSGKTTFVRGLYEHLRTSTRKDRRLRLYCINLDPATADVPFPVNIDIRDVVKYKEVMKNYQLGPNGAIMTCLNLFATKFDQVLKLLEKRAPSLDYVIVDTPGQIEVFNWSASGSIILDSFAVSYPTIVSYVLDTERCQNPTSFMSNMMYACSVLYKTRLPFIAVFNKTDVVSPEQCAKWMEDDDAFREATEKDEEYISTLSRSCALAMSEFYRGLRSVKVSALTGSNLDTFEEAAEEATKEYETEYMSWLSCQRDAVKKRREAEALKQLKRLQEDLKKGELQDDEELAEKVRKLRLGNVMMRRVAEENSEMDDDEMNDDDDEMGDDDKDNSMRINT